MSATLNRCFLVGRLARDPEVGQTQAGQAVCRLRLAVNEAFASKATGERREVTTFLDVVAWGALAERCGQFLAKGRAVLVEGRLYADEWTDKATGKQRQQVRVRADRVGFLGGGEPGAAPGASPTAPGSPQGPAAGAGAAQDLPF